MLFNLIFHTLFKNFNFARALDFYSSKVIFKIFKVYIVILLYTSILSFLPFFQTETSNFIFLIFSNVINILVSIIIFLLLFYRILSESVDSNTNIIFLFFFILLELISHLIRLISSTLRICANATSGHILMLMISNMLYFTLFSIIYIKSVIILILFILFYILFLILEISVSAIQIYVVLLLVLFYVIEIE